MRTSRPVDAHRDFIHRFDDSRFTIFPQAWQRYSLISFGVECDLRDAFRCLVSGFDGIEDCDIGFLRVAPHHGEDFVAEFIGCGVQGRTSGCTQPIGAAEFDSGFDALTAFIGE